MITKKRFRQLMEELVSLKQDEENFREAFKKFEPEGGNLFFSRHENLVVDSLKEAINDKNLWISYWLYELNCGKEHNRLKVTKDGKRVPMKTIDNLYDCITYAI